jgi:hypothetical protein
VFSAAAAPEALAAVLSRYRRPYCDADVLSDVSGGPYQGFVRLYLTTNTDAQRGTVQPPAAVRRPHRVAAGRRSATAATTRTRRVGTLPRVLRRSEADRRCHRARAQPCHDVGGPQPELVQGKPADDLATEVRAPVVGESRVTRGVADDRPSQLLCADAWDTPREGPARIPASRSQGLRTVRAEDVHVALRRRPLAPVDPASGDITPPRHKPLVSERTHSVTMARAHGAATRGPCCAIR